MLLIYAKEFLTQKFHIYKVKHIHLSVDIMDYTFLKYVSRHIMLKYTI